MPRSPSPAQRAASRANGRKSRGPKNTANSCRNALTHGFTASLRLPDDPQDRELFDTLLTGLYEEFLPASPAERLVLEQIVMLELRRIRIQEALLASTDFLSEADLKRTALLSRYETETINKLEKAYKKLEALQTSRRQRRGLAVEAALLQPELEAARQQLGDHALALAERALRRELLDLGRPPEEADRLTRELLGSGSFRNKEPLAPPLPTQDQTRAQDTPGLPRVIPGPPWNPWHGASPEQLEAWNDELIEHRKQVLRAELEELERATEPPEELIALRQRQTDTADPTEET